MKRKITASPAQHQATRFGIVFLLVSGVLFFLLNWLPAPYVKPLNIYTAKLAGMLIELTGVDVSVNGVFVSTGTFGVKIITECSAIFVVILYLSFVAAYPATVRQKAAGLALGIPVLFTVNTIRLAAVFLTGMHHRGLFDYAHVYIGQILMILLVLSVCLVWLRSVVHVRTKDSPGAFILRFIAFSSLPFVFWVFIDEAYVFANLYLVKQVFGLFSRPITVPGSLRLYPDTFNTFHLIAFTALVLATRSIDRRRKRKGLIVGLALLAAMHLLFRFHEVLYFGFSSPFTLPSFVALIIINQWILPFLLWVAVVRGDLFAKDPAAKDPGAGG
ncbi:MAG: exosortase H [Thermodesulfobacteriota bacterium]|nr:exosortase H [Thermodesulfobacteriota bacterium]